LRAPEVWSQFLRFSQKASVESFITEEEAFLVSETSSNHHRARVVTRIGRHTEQSIRHYCLDLMADIAALQEMTEVELIAACKGAPRPVVTVRTNAAPTLWALYDATPEHLAPFDEAEVLEMAARIRGDKPFLERLCSAAQAAEPTYAPSPHVEEQLYERGFPPPQDESLMRHFHSAPWEERPALAQQFEDERYRRLANRLIYFERPDLLDDTFCRAAAKELQKRLLAPTEVQTPWRSIPVAQCEVEKLIASGIEGDSLIGQLEYAAYLVERAEVFAPA